jgi:hypothetical protein
VALSTLSLGNRSMGHVKDDTPGIGAMRVVAGNAVLIRHRVIHVRPFESEFFNLMTLGTEGRRFPLQQETRSGRGMRIMTVEATFTLVQGSVLESNLAELSAHSLVAVKTEFTACFFQDVSVARPMGSVTDCAFALDHSIMCTASFLWKHILVAIVAKLCGGSDQQPFVRRGVRHMAAGTIPLFHEWVDITAFEDFF